MPSFIRFNSFAPTSLEPTDGYTWIDVNAITSVVESTAGPTRTTIFTIDGAMHVVGHPVADVMFSIDRGVEHARKQLADASALVRVGDNISIASKD